MLQTLLTHVGGSGAIWFSTDIGVSNDSFLGFNGHDFDIGVYMEHYFPIDGWHAEGSRHAAGETMILSEEFNRKTFRDAEFYNDFCIPVIKAASVCCANIDPQSNSHLSIYRGPGDPEFSPATRRLWSELMPHLHNWRLMAAKIGALGRSVSLLTQALNNLAVGVGVVDRTLKVIETNGAMDAILAANGPLLVRSGKLGCRISSEADTFKHLASTACRTSMGDGTGPGGMLRVTGLDGRSMNLSISPLRRIITGLKSDGYALVVASDLASGQKSRASMLAELYGLTRAESEVADLLSQGVAARDISDRRMVSIQTVQTQIKSILQKAGIKRQSEFIHAVSWLYAFRL